MESVGVPLGLRLRMDCCVGMVGFRALQTSSGLGFRVQAFFTMLASILMTPIMFLLLLLLLLLIAFDFIAVILLLSV
jgi:hypothetical protein